MGVVLLSVKLVSMAGSRETEKDVMPAVEVMAPRVGGSSNVPLEGYRFPKKASSAARSAGSWHSQNELGRLSSRKRLFMASSHCSQS